MNRQQSRHFVHVHSRFQFRRVFAEPDFQQINGLFGQPAFIVDCDSLTEHLLYMFKHKMTGHFDSERLLQPVIDVEKIKRLCTQIFDQ